MLIRKISSLLFLFVVLLMFNVGCAAATALDVGEISAKPATDIEVGQKTTLYVDARGTTGLIYKWSVNGGGEFDGNDNGSSVIYIAPGKPGPVTITVTVTDPSRLTVTKTISLMVSDPTTPTPVVTSTNDAISVLMTPTSTQEESDGSILIKPTSSIELSSAKSKCPNRINVHGVIDELGNIKLDGLRAGKQYLLSLNGEKPSSASFNKVICGDAQCPDNNDHWDFATVTADAKGVVSEKLIATPFGMNFSFSDAYDVKFFVKDIAANYCTLFSADKFIFKVELAP